MVFGPKVINAAQKKGHRLPQVLLALVVLLLMSGAFEVFIRSALFRPQWINRLPGGWRLTFSIQRAVFYWSDFGISDAGQKLVLYSSVRQHKAHWWQRAYNFDPDLGWIRAHYSPTNPIAPYEISNLPQQRRLIFYGDSFVDGWSVARDETITARLEEELDSTTVLNLGVSGYGLDQIYLRFMKTIDSFDSAHVLVGIFHDDLNRCLYQVFEIPKPRFSVSEGKLQLHPLRCGFDPEQWVREYPPDLGRCFAFELASGVIHKLLCSPFVLYRMSPNLANSESRTDREQVAVLTRRLITELRDECARRKLPLTFVLFPDVLIVMEKYQSWRHQLLLEIMEEMNLSFVDCAESYRNYLAANPELAPLAIFEESRHPRPDLYRLMAKQVAENLHRFHGYSIK